MTWLMLPLVLLAADTGGTRAASPGRADMDSRRTAPVAAVATVGIYGGSALNPCAGVWVERCRTAADPLVRTATARIYGENAINRDVLRGHIRPPNDRWFGADKFQHLALSYLITAGTFGAARLIADHDASLTIGIVAGAAGGIGKEIHDHKRQGASYRDLVWDAAGIAAAVLIAQETR